MNTKKPCLLVVEIPAAFIFHFCVVDMLFSLRLPSVSLFLFTQNAFSLHLELTMKLIEGKPGISCFVRIATNFKKQDPKLLMEFSCP